MLKHAVVISFLAVLWVIFFVGECVNSKRGKTIPKEDTPTKLKLNEIDELSLEIYHLVCKFLLHKGIRFSETNDFCVQMVVLGSRNVQMEFLLNDLHNGKLTIGVEKAEDGCFLVPLDIFGDSKHVGCEFRMRTFTERHLEFYIDHHFDRFYNETLKGKNTEPCFKCGKMLYWSDMIATHDVVLKAHVVKHSEYLVLSSPSLTMVHVCTACFYRYDEYKHGTRDYRNIKNSGMKNENNNYGV